MARLWPERIKEFTAAEITQYKRLRTIENKIILSIIILQIFNKNKKSYTCKQFKNHYNTLMFKKYLKALKDIIFTPLCLDCGKKIDENYLCARCQNKIMFLGIGLCSYCYQDKIYHFNQAISITAYKEPMVKLIHLFKYKNCDYLADFFAKLMIEHLLKIKVNFSGYDAMLSVPMHRDKLKKRGYNQAELLAKPLSNYFKIPLRNDIINCKNVNASQTKLSKVARQKNVAGAFTVNGNLKDKNLLLIDDILTTGSTINACAKTLRENGAKRITIITLAKTLN